MHHATSGNPQKTLAPKLCYNSTLILKLITSIKQLIPYSWFFSGYVNSANFADDDHSWNLIPRKKPTIHCSLWAFGRPIRENKIVKNLKISPSQNLSTPKKTNYTVGSSLLYALVDNSSYKPYNYHIGNIDFVVKFLLHYIFMGKLDPWKYLTIEFCLHWISTCVHFLLCKVYMGSGYTQCSWQFTLVGVSLAIMVGNSCDNVYHCNYRVFSIITQY